MCVRFSSTCRCIFNGRPTVTAVIHPREDPAAGGVAFVIYNITVVPTALSKAEVTESS